MPKINYTPHIIGTLGGITVGVLLEAAFYMNLSPNGLTAPEKAGCLLIAAIVLGLLTILAVTVFYAIRQEYIDHARREAEAEMRAAQAKADCARWERDRAYRESLLSSNRHLSLHVDNLERKIRARENDIVVEEVDPARATPYPETPTPDPWSR